jgi:putative membrane protein insertion efficiency factor
MARGVMRRVVLPGREFVRNRRMRSFYEQVVRLALRVYKLTLSPLIGQACRFHPTCSEYAADALITHGPARGAALALRRVCRCHPWGGAGHDPVPPPRDAVESAAP